MFKFWSGTHGLNEELGRHRGRNGRTECVLCGDECESVVHVLWECPAYKDSKEEFMKENHTLLSLILSPRLRIRGMVLWLVGREEVSLISSVTQGE